MSIGIRRRVVPWLAVVGLAAASFVTVTAVAPARAATTYVVDTVVDNGALTACTAAADDCSLRGAVAAANANPGVDTINFNIPAGSCPGGVCRITLTDGPLVLTEAVEVDGTTQPQNGAPQANVCAAVSDPSYMRIEVVTAPTSGSGIAFQIDHATGSSTIRGFAFGTDDNVGVNSAINVIDGSGHQIACNHFGLNAAGSAQLGTLEFNMGVLIEFSATGVVIGTDGDGTADLAERNVFGPGGFAVYVNANDSNRISGNFIGLTADGTTRVQAGRIFIRQSSGHNLIGTDENGTSDDLERNYFGTYEGVLLTADGFQPTDNRVVGNTFGFTPAGVPLDITYAVSVDSLDAIETGYEIRKNIIGSAVTGVHVTGAEAGASVLISDNLFGAAPDGSATAYPNTTAILLDGAGSHAVSDNDILNSTGDGISVADTATFAAGSTGNCVINNGAGVANSTGIGVTFESNFWGASNGPSGAGPGSGDSVSADVDYVPWLDTPPARCNTAPVLDDTTFAVAEDAAIGTVVGTIAAIDDGPTVDYSITAGNISGAFAIDTTSGAITTAAALDYETTPVLRTHRRSDRWSPQRHRHHHHQCHRCGRDATEHGTGRLRRVVHDRRRRGSRIDRRHGGRNR